MSTSISRKTFANHNFRMSGMPVTPYLQTAARAGRGMEIECSEPRCHRDRFSAAEPRSVGGTHQEADRHRRLGVKQRMGMRLLIVYGAFEACAVGCITLDFRLAWAAEV